MKFLDLFRPKWQHPDSWVRKAAVAKLTDQVVLAEVAKNDSAWEVRRAAVAKLTDQVVLAEVAENDSDPEVHWAAVNKLTDIARHLEWDDSGCSHEWEFDSSDTEFDGQQWHKWMWYKCKKCGRVEDLDGG